ncbi:hypothetical protein [Ramlibacter sp. AN1133]|uniref:hypothetical protein n=1 Tax=Ramlibacter sp. AN1133 TaxID=3133429 RepID=UPI0030C3ED83
MSWIFERSGPMGGAAGEAYANTLKSPGMPPAHVLAREAIQNSVDAGNGAKVAVRFRATSLANTAKRNFVEAAGLVDIVSRAEALKLGPNSLSTLEKARTPLRLLYVEDYNAEGLSGEPHDSGSNFYRLLLSLGDRAKARGGKGTGGSYGFGKSVYSSSSAIQTIFAYTRFEDGDGKERTRVFGCGYYASHEFRHQGYSGRAWHGTKERMENGFRVVDPLEGLAAERLAEKLGFELRAEGETGTSILIVDADVDTQEIVRGVEDWWWPRLVENRLDVDILDADGNKHLPRPRKRADLKPFIDAFDIARMRAEPKGGTQARFEPNRELGVDIGTCGVVVVPAEDSGAPVVPGERCNCVALIRSPLMVVAYKSVSESAPPVVGAFVASGNDELETALKNSEPPAHDRWDPDSTNLRDETGRGRRLVNAVLSRVKAGVRRFQQNAAPPTPPKQRRLTLLERALGSLFKPQGHGGGIGPDPTASPLHLEFTKQPYAEATEDGMLRVKSTFMVKLDDHAADDLVELRLRVNCPVLEDDNEEGDDLPIEVSCEGVRALVDEADPFLFRFRLAKGEKAKFSVASEKYDPAWTVRLRPDIDREEA